MDNIYLLIISGMASIVLFSASLIVSLLRENRKTMAQNIKELNKKMDDHTEKDEETHREMFKMINEIRHRVNGDLLNDIKKVIQNEIRNNKN